MACPGAYRFNDCGGIVKISRPQAKDPTTIAGGFGKSSEKRLLIVQFEEEDGVIIE
jgi:hypothetical protein